MRPKHIYILLVVFFSLSQLGYARTKYSLNNFDNFEHMDEFSPNHFFGNWGPLIAECVDLAIDTSMSVVNPGNCLKISFHDLERNVNNRTFTGIWQSVWSFSDSLSTALDMTEFDSLEFFIRGSGLNPGITYRIKLEFKSNYPPEIVNDYQAYQYINLSDASLKWQRVAVSCDVENGLADWRYFWGPPDRRRIKMFNIVLEANQNLAHSGTFYIDDISFIKANEEEFVTAKYTDKEFLSYINKRSFRFFEKMARPDNGLIPDRASFPDLYTVAGCGFALSAYAIAAHNGWMMETDANNRAKLLLKTMDAIQRKQNLSGNAGRYGVAGFFYHFLDASGARKDSTELSSVDTALLLCGAISAGEYFGGEVKTLADSIYRRVNWPWFLNKAKNQFYLGWSPKFQAQTPIAAPFQIHETDYNGYFSGSGQTAHTWDYYTDEVMLISILAIASPTHPVPVNAMFSWNRTQGSYLGQPFIQSWTGSLFTYFFAHCWLPMKELDTDKSVSGTLFSGGINWYENSRNAAKANHAYCVDNRSKYSTYHELSWGITACESGKWLPPLLRYQGWGALPTGDGAGPASNGTIAPYGTAGAITVLPEKAIPALKYYFNNTKLWHPLFGFIDAYNTSREIQQYNGGPWYNYNYFSIDVGPALIMIDNYLNNGFITWKFINNKFISVAVDALFTDVNNKQEIQPERSTLAQNYPNPFNGTTTILFELDQTSLVTIDLYNTNGELVEKIVSNQRMASGSHTIQLDASRLPTGLYYYQLAAGSARITKKLLLIK